MHPTTLAPFAVGLLTGLATRPVARALRRVAMGCFSSKMVAPVNTAAATRAPPAAIPSGVPVEVSAKADAAGVAISAPSGVRREDPVTDLDRATLALKSRRDKMEQQLAAAQEQCDADMRKAVEAKREGRDDWAVFLLKRRKVVQKRAENAMGSITQCETMLSTVGKTKDLALVQAAMQESTKALREFSKVCNAETVSKANEDWRAQKEEVREVEAVLNEAVEDDGFVMPTMEELDAEIAAYEGTSGEAKVEPAVGLGVVPEADGDAAQVAGGEELEVTPEEQVVESVVEEEEEEEEEDEQIVEKPKPKPKAKAKAREPILA